MKLLKKTLSFLLCMIILVSSVGFTLASAQDSYDHLPQIYVGGLGCMPVYYKDDPEQTNLFYPIDFARVFKNLLKSGDYIMGAIRSKNPDLLYEYLYAWLWDSFGMLALKPDGVTMSDEVTVDEIILKYEGNGKYLFDYDSRLDPVDVAKQLHTYISWVQEDSGSESFELVGSSYGTTVVVAYLNEYPEMQENIDSVVLCVPSVGGINFFGEIFSGELNIEGEALKGFLKEKIGLKLTPVMLGLMQKGGILDALIDSLAEPVLREAVFDAGMQIIRDVIATLPASWTCVKDEHFESSMINVFGEDYSSPDHEYSGLISKVTYYHNNVKVNAEKIMESAKNNGIKMNIICKYGNAPVPFSKDGNFAGDGIVELKVSSFGATCAGHQQKLPDSYTQALYRDYDFMSPDGCVDASTGAYPFNTWYIKGLAHGGKNEDYFRLIDAVAYDDLDVFGNPLYPQFLEVPEDDAERLVPMLGNEDEGFFQKIINSVVAFFKKLMESIRNLFG